MDLTQYQDAIRTSVAQALAEDIGTGDITAQLIPESQQGHARIISREQAVIAGRPWVDEVFRQVDPAVEVVWLVKEGEQVSENQVLFELKGKSRSLLTGERCALNFLQTLSGTATLCRHYADLVAGTQVKLLDTRKTLPGLRIAQKYAVTQGGCFNHRIGLYDAFLIKENHIMAAGSISAAVAEARRIAADKPVEVEVETFTQLDEAIAAADIIMLDNFTPADMITAVAHTRKLSAGRIKLEASGGINRDTLRQYAETGVDYISIGALTKDCRAVDLSMRMVTPD
ncbi:MAG TPA: carboxylating nicotinate-nucleotide diphosphorylase [Oceanospirillales bacterium]|nr:nicotinate-nucleotide diphosphorylase (carboxylating) [Oceanospirillaceae bacterium]HBS42233.1 carboxylating nicotinate-nucleotide diphosphorylase [Oceanospirillales bacterium]|tara:strand:+ start:2585 stop:3439 length:855 start_codon:yes stop_codon:yes gene_type:complete